MLQDGASHPTVPQSQLPCTHTYIQIIWDRGILSPNVCQGSSGQSSTMSLHVLIPRFPCSCLLLWVPASVQLHQACQAITCEGRPWWWRCLCLWLLFLGHEMWVFHVFLELNGTSDEFLRGYWALWPVGGNWETGRELNKVFTISELWKAQAPPKIH